MKELTVTVKKEFLDRYTGVKHKVGEKLKVTDRRLREIKRSGDYVDILKTSAVSPKEK